MTMLVHLGHAEANAIGFIGTACIVFAYGYATYAKTPNPFVQHGVNLAGAAFLTVSLLVNMNLASFVLEFFWAAIAIWGLAKAWRARRVKP
ncbi:permease [Novosphingobium sp.]|uniref:CBU_0592 family membrane protein n=1 Tax=Novosphingobium sp. TaxID=1874826 RepID=UPI0035B47D97